MNKRLLFSAVLAAMIGANEAQAYHPMAIPAQVFAQTESGGVKIASGEDVTAQYLKNAGFDNEADFQTANVSTKNIKNVSDWTAESKASDCLQSLGAVFQIGSSATFNGASVPGTNADGGTTGGVLAFSMGWGQTVKYTQELTDLPAGVYHFEYLAYNTNDKGVGKNLIGYIDGDGNSYYGTKTSFEKGKWVKESVNFEVVEGKSGKFSIGFQSINTQSTNNAKVCIDYIKIYKGIVIPAKAEAQAALDKYNYQGDERTTLENLLDKDPATLAEADDFNAQIIAATQKFCHAAEEALILAGEHGDYIKGYRAIKQKYTNDVSSLLGNVSSWEGNMVTNKGQHWSGNGNSTYWEQTGAMWGQNSWTVNKKTSISLPKGKYAMVVAARTSASVEGYLKVGDKAVSIINNGDSGYGITTDGDASYNPYDTYANTNGRGWEWRTIEFEVTTSDPVDIEFGGSTNVKQQWMSVGDITLLTTADAQTLYADNFNNVLETYKYDASSYLGDVSTWEGSFSTNHGQHWSGDDRTYYDHYEDKAWSQNKTTTISSLPAGKYVLIASGRGSKNAAWPYIKVGDKKIYFATKDGEGRGIDINGNATFDESATYSNSGKGNGWEWRALEFEVAEDNTPVSFEIGATGNANTWASICDVALKTSTNREYEISLAELTTILEKAQAAVPTVNIGDAAFLISQTTVDAFKKVIADAETVKNNADATTDDLKAATTKLNEAILTYSYKDVALNKPKEGEKFNIVINGNDGYQSDGKTLTFKSGNAGNGEYAMGYSEPGGSFYKQTVTMVPVDGTTNGYLLAIDETDGTQTYVGTGENYKGNKWQLRATPDKEKALTVKIEATAKDGLYHLRNTVADMLIAANGEKDEGFYTANKEQWSNFNLVAAVKNTATLKVTDAKWATFIAPFDVVIPEGVSAYTCAAADGTSLTLTETTGTLKANTPYILYAETSVAQQVEGYALAKTDAYKEGWLTGVYTERNLTKDAGNYVLQNQDGRVAFYLATTDNVKCVANRAYLTVPAEVSDAKMFTFGGDVTAISKLTGNTGAVEVERYNAAGAKVTAPVKGLNLVKMSDGSIIKVIVK